jgi:murein DD-endopeptidase MepM/ murein hydrolase activator NlpD
MQYKRSDSNFSRKQKNEFILFAFCRALLGYLLYRIKQIVLIFLGVLKVLIDAFSGLKSYVVHRMFWGRGSLYRTAFHFVVFSITLIVLVSGVSTKLNIFAAETKGLTYSGAIVGRKDIIFQSGTAESLSMISADETDLLVYKYIVQKDDTLSSIAKVYSKNISTLVWANNLVSKDAVLKVNQVLRIPAIDGAYYTIKSGDTLEKIAKTTSSSVDEIIDLNGMDRANLVIAAGTELFLPNGVIPTPPPVKKPSSGGSYSGGKGNIVNIPNGMLVNPLKDCPGYVMTSGYGWRWGSFHYGVDLAKNGGCWITAAGNGVVTLAGRGSYGFTTAIDHGSGIKTTYGHGNGTFAVRQGDTVKAGQRIMYMGCSGYCSGTHLDFRITINGNFVNPTNYIRF